MLRILIALVLVGACGPSLQTVQLVNRTPRTIAEIYLYPSGSTNHGKSRGSLAPNATLDAKLATGNVEVLAVSEKIRVDQGSETKTASLTFSLAAPVTLVFHDSSQPPPGLDRPGTLGVAFRVDPEPEPPKDEPDVTP